MYRVADAQQSWFKPVSSLLKANAWGVKLLPRDLAIYTAVVDRINWRVSPRCEYSLTALAEEIGMDPKTVIKSVSRLKQVHVLITGRDRASGKRFVLVNPTYVYSGDPRRQQTAQKEWVALWEKEHDSDVLRQQMEDEEAWEKQQAHNRAIDASERFAVS